MRPLDWIVIAAYLFWIVADGLKRTKGTKGVEGYLLANRSLPWWAVGLSVMATQLSAITLVGTTGQAYADGMRDLLEQSLDSAELRGGQWVDVGRGPGSRAGGFVEWLTIADQAKSVVDDVTRIRTHPLVSPSIAIYGYVYDVATGRLAEVLEASSVGRVAAAAHV